MSFAALVEVKPKKASNEIDDLVTWMAIKQPTLTPLNAIPKQSKIAADEGHTGAGAT